MDNPSREKFWNEMNQKEQIDKLRKELMRTQSRLNDICGYVSKLIEHDHKDSKIIVKLRNPNEESYGGIYFRQWEPKIK